MTVQQIVDGAQALTCCLPYTLLGAGRVWVLNQLLSGAGGGEGVSLLSNLYDHWSFDGTMNGVNGRIFSAQSVTYGAGLVTPKALSLDATAATVARCLAATSIGVGSQYNCGVFWTNFNSVATSMGLVSTIGAGGIGFSTVTNVGRYRLVVGALNITEATAIVAGAWHMCAFNAISDGVNTSFVSIDDGTVNASGVGALRADSPSPLTVGQIATLTGAIMNGLIQGLTIWTNRQLSAADILYLYNGGAGRRYPFFI